MRKRYICWGIMLPIVFILVLATGWVGSISRAAAREHETVSAVKHFIYVPLTRQNANYTCGVTAFQSILGYYGLDKRLDELASALKPDQENGTNYLSMEAYAKSQGFEVNIQTEMTLAELKGYIDQKKPVLLAIQAWADSCSVYSSLQNEDGHYVVAIGYDDRNFYFMDPSTLGHYTYIPTAEFVARWHDYDSYGNKVLNRFGMVITKSIAASYNPNEIMRLE